MVISMERWNGQLAIVTGEGGGIGGAIVQQLVESGLKVVGVDYRKEGVEELAKNLHGKTGQLYAFCADVTKEDEILKAFQWAKENVGAVHILINCAGVGRVTTLVEGDTKLWKDVLDVNVLGLCIATKKAVKDMRANNVDGHIIHLNSMAGHTLANLPHINMYGASKHAVTALAETLRMELNSFGSKIKVTSISPGLVATKIYENSARASGLPEFPKERREALNALPVLQPNDIADAIIYVLSTPPHVQIHELMIKPIGELC